MSDQRPFFFLGVLRIWAILLLTCLSHPSFAEEPIKAESPAYIYNSAYENERVTVIRVRLKPGDKIPMRFHPDHVVYITSPGKLRFAFPKGLPLVTETKIDEVYWGPAGKNSTENIGHTEVNAI